MLKHSENNIMEENFSNNNKKSGRPKKDMNLEKPVSVRYTYLQKIILESRASECEMDLSEYIRNISLNGKVEVFKKNIPKEVLGLVGSLYHIQANVNQLSKRNNRGDFLTEADNNNLREWLKNLSVIVRRIENYLFHDSASETK